MKTTFTMFRRGGVFYAQDSATGRQTSLRTKDETEAKSLLMALEPKLFNLLSDIARFASSSMTEFNFRAQG